MLIQKADGEVVFDQDKCVGIKKLVSNDTEFVTLAIQSGGGMFKHALPFDVTFYISNGEGIATVNGVETKAQSGDMLTVKAGAERSWDNASTGELTLFVVKHMGSSPK